MPLFRLNRVQHRASLALALMLSAGFPTVLPGEVSAPESLIDVASRLDECVWFVVTGSTWEEGGAYGTFRVVVLGGGVEHVVTRTYGQWLRFDESTGKDVILKTVAIEPLNISLAIVRSVALLESRPGRAVFEITRLEREAEQPTSVTLELGLPGHFKVTSSQRSGGR